jgi:hypothetical protein
MPDASRFSFRHLESFQARLDGQRRHEVTEGLGDRDQNCLRDSTVEHLLAHDVAPSVRVRGRHQIMQQR